MTVFADTTRIAILEETDWGVAPTGQHTILSLTSENLNPELRHIRPQSLNRVVRTAPVLTESFVSGEIEGIAGMGLLGALLPYVMMGDATQEMKWSNHTFETDASGRIINANPAPGMKDGDFIWVKPLGKIPGVVAGFYPITQAGSRAYISGLPANASMFFSIGFYRNIIREKEGLKSFSLIRRLGDDGKWLRFAGTCVQRLVLDAGEASLMTITASLIGKATGDGPTAPRFATASEADPLPLTLADSAYGFRIAASGSTPLDHNDLTLTGLRLVLDRVGMSPRHVLGSDAPSLITPGRLAVSGNLEMLIGNESLFSWLLSQESLTISIVLGDGKADDSNAIAIAMQKVKLTDVEHLPRGSDGLLAVRFGFIAEYAQNGDAIRFFIKTGEVNF